MLLLVTLWNARWDRGRECLRESEASPHITAAGAGRKKVVTRAGTPTIRYIEPSGLAGNLINWLLELPRGGKEIE